MKLTRRDALATGAAAVAAAALPFPALAANNSAEVITEFTGGADVSDGAVTIDAPEIAENGNTVPVSVSAEGAVAILLVSTENPQANIAQFNFSAMTPSTASTRIRLARTQDIIAVAKMEDGSFVQASKPVKVTIGGCGG